MRQPERDMLAGGAQALGLTLDAGQLDAMSSLLDALTAANARFNLSAIRDPVDMLRKHLLDSLTANPFLEGERIADVGTGAGFPGLPLAIANPARRFTLIEATGKKARFVAETSRALGCANVEVVHARAESYRPAARFDTVIARALASLADFVAQAGHLCAAGGCLLAMKGRRPDQEIAALPRGYRVRAVNRVTIPGLPDERHIVEIVHA